MTEVAQRLEQVRQRIAAACRTASRDSAAVTLVAVSKRKPIDAIRAAYDAGQRDFGENYAQDLAAKAEALRDLPDLRWHFIGALQRNKAKLVVPCATLIHGVDSEALLRKLDALAGQQGKVQSVLLQVNVTGESSKSGMSVDAVVPFLHFFAETANLCCTGLMTMPELEGDPAPTFAQLRSLRDRLAEAALANVRLTELSMGMTADMEAAIAEGATTIRVGTAIFGPR